MSREQDPLSPEERTLASALASAASRRGPSPQVDAAILASARSAVAKETAPPARRAHRRRWQATLGVAASLAVAVGIAWQLRPVPEQALPAPGGDVMRPAPATAEQAPAAARHSQAPTDSTTAPAGGTPPAPATKPADAGPAADPPSGPAVRYHEPVPARSGIREDSPAPQPLPPPALPVPPPPAPEAQAMKAEPAAAAAESTESISAPPAAETAIGRDRVRQQTRGSEPLGRVLDTPAAVARPPAAPSPPAAEDDGGIVFDRQALHDVPPATVDSPGIHRAWLDRIRELREAGETEAARESLREYRRRYPQQPLPDDLDGLLDE